MHSQKSEVLDNSLALGDKFAYSLLGALGYGSIPLSSSQPIQYQ
jgi:hypothetical protein